MLAPEERQNPADTSMAENENLPPRYRKPRRVGQGGMGDIFRALDSMLDREVAIKVLAERYAEDDATRMRFTREALAAARLSGDPAIVTIFDVGEWDGRPFIVMEYLGGGSLEDRLREGRPPISRSLGWLEQAARALDTAHSQGIVHRDVKPGNLLLDEGGAVHVADFGIASATGMDSLTVAGTILGTAGYLSPEQAMGERATPASDRYALGVVAFELLTGRRPFARESPTAEAAAHANDPVPSVADYELDLPASELDPVFRRALAKSPSDRYETGFDLVNDLLAALSRAETSTREFAPVPVPAATHHAPPRSRAPSTRTFALVGLLVGALAAGAALAAALAGGDDGSSSPQVSVVRRTVTEQGRTVERSVTVTTTAPAAPAEEEGDGDEDQSGGSKKVKTKGGSFQDGVALTDDATALIDQGRYEEALAKAQQALAILEGTGETYEGYASFNAGKALAELGRCAEALPYLEKRERMLGPDPRVTAAKEKCS